MEQDSHLDQGSRWWTFVSEKHPGYRWYWRGRWGVCWNWPCAWRSTFWLTEPPVEQIVKNRERAIQLLAGALLAIATVAFFMLGLWISNIQWPLAIQILGGLLLALSIVIFLMFIVWIASRLRNIGQGAH